MSPSTFLRRTSCLAAISLSLTLPAGRVAAQSVQDEPWFLTIDGMVAAPINDLPRQQFGVGGGGSIGLYRSIIPEVSLGLRVGAGALSGRGPIAQDPVDRGALDWGSLSATVRVRPLASMDPDRRASGLWLEVGAGPWLIDGSVNPVFDAGLGYGVGIGPIVLSPLVRFTHVIETHGRYGDVPILIGSAGLEVAWNDRVAAPVAERVDLAPPVVATPAPAALPPEEDVAMPFVNDQLIIDERVFFDFDRWELRPTGVEQLEEVVRRYEESGGRWQALVVSGHADRRGPEQYNVELSRKRAETVRDFLTAHGVPDGILEIQAWGEAQPAIPDATTEWEHQVNRRVQFEIVWRPGERPEGVAPVPHPTMPEYVDPAPEDRREEP